VRALGDLITFPSNTFAEGPAASVTAGPPIALDQIASDLQSGQVFDYTAPTRAVLHAVIVLSSNRAAGHHWPRKPCGSLERCRRGGRRKRTRVSRAEYDVALARTSSRPDNASRSCGSFWARLRHRYGSAVDFRPACNTSPTAPTNHQPTSSSTTAPEWPPSMTKWRDKSFPASTISRAMLWRAPSTRIFPSRAGCGLRIALDLAESP